MNIWEWEQDGERPSSSMWAPAALGQVMAVLMGGVKAKLNSRGDCHRDTRWLQPRASAQTGRGSWQSATRASTNSQHPNTHDLDCKAANRLCLLLTPVDCWWLLGRVGTEGRSGSARRDATDRPCHTDSRRGAQPIFRTSFQPAPPPALLNPTLLSGLRLSCVQSPGRRSPEAGEGSASQVQTVDSGSSKRWLPQTQGELGWGIQAELPLCSARGTLTAGEGPEGSSASPVRQADLCLPSGIVGGPKPPPTSTFRPKGRGSRTEAGGLGQSPSRQGGSAHSGHHLPFWLTAGHHAEEQTGHGLITQAPRSWAGLSTQAQFPVPRTP